jgi:hypothetical protein
MFTFDLLESFAMKLADHIVLLLQALQAPIEGIGDFQARVIQFVSIFVIFQGSLHLLDRLDNLVCFFSQIVLLTVEAG